MIQDAMFIKLLPILLEVLALFYFAEHFFIAKVGRIQRYLANACFYALDCCTIYLPGYAPAHSGRFAQPKTGAGEKP